MTTARVGVDITAQDRTSPAFMSAIANVNKLGKATQVMGDRQRNMAYQLNDVFAQISTGTSPLTVLMQQGPQIAQIYGFGNGGVAAAFRDVGNMLLVALKRVGPFAAVAGTIAAALTYEVNRASGEAYTMGEVFRATGDVIWDAMSSRAAPAVSGLFAVVKTVFNSILDVVKTDINLMIGYNVVWVSAVKRIVGELPDVFKFIGAAVANNFLDGIDALVIGTKTALNSLIKAINRVFEQLPDSIRPPTLTPFSEGGIFGNMKFDTKSLWDKVSNPFKGFGSEIGTIMGTDYVGAFTKAIGDKAAQNRVTDAVKKSFSGIKPGAARAAKPGSAKGGSDGGVVGVAEAFNGLEGVESIFTQIGNYLSDKFGSVIDAVIDKTMSLKDAFKEMAHSMLKDAAKLAFKGMLFGGFSGQSSGGGLGGLLGSLFGMLPSFAVGADRVPRDMVAQIHKGEMIVPSGPAEALRNGGVGGGAVSVHIYPSDEFGAQVKAEVRQGMGQAVRASVQQSLRATKQNFGSMQSQHDIREG